MSKTDIIFECQDCGWAYSLQRNQTCPMCDTAPELDKKFIRETLQEYARRKGIFLKKRTCKKLIGEFEEHYGRLPSFKEVWSLADKAVVQVKEGKDVSLDVRIQKKVQKMKKKEQAKVQRKKELAKKRKTSETKEEVVQCSECGHENPSDSKFCLECGNKLK